ncbi:MAG: tRNA 2-thiouridine(34) synthase MnmA [Bdellovibrio sp.]
MSKGRVLVAMSGGVDSSAAAALLVEQGYEVIGATMQVWDYSTCDIEEGHGTCCSSIDVDDARAVADRLSIPFYVLNCEAKFRAAVIDPFLKAYMEGQTPVPCVNCNTYLKFDHLVKKMQELECDYLATGHYARIVHDEHGRAAIHTSTDDWKDQTYFLFTIDPALVPKLLFPVGGMTKPEVRAYSESRGLITAKKKDSQGICFVGNQGYQNFIESQVPAAVLAAKRGPLKRYPHGETMAMHEGIHHFTIGQSKGLGMDHHEKLFVIKIDTATNTVWVGDEEYLFAHEVDVVDPQLLGDIQDGEVLNVKIRYQHKGSLAQVFRRDKGFTLKFTQPQRAVTPGQAAVFYRDRELVGGGWITL